jgi:hypothetical protein
MTNDTATREARQLAFRRSLESLAVAVTAAEAANAELERDRTPIDRETEAQLIELVHRVDHLQADGRYEGTDYGDASPPPAPVASNPIRAFMLATKPLDGSCFCGNDSFQRGRDLLAAMVASFVEVDGDGTIRLPLSGDDCHDVLEYLGCTEAREPAELRWGGDSEDGVREKYHGDPSFGLFLVMQHVREQLRQGGAQ